MAAGKAKLQATGGVAGQVDQTEEFLVFLAKVLAFNADAAV